MIVNETHYQVPQYQPPKDLIRLVIDFVDLIFLNILDIIYFDRCIMEYTGEIVIFIKT
jgi:hypothetical protein